MELAELEHEAEAERGLWQQQLLQTKTGIEEKAAKVREPSHLPDHYIVNYINMGIPLDTVKASGCVNNVHINPSIYQPLPNNVPVMFQQYHAD